MIHLAPTEEKSWFESRLDNDRSFFFVDVLSFPRHGAPLGEAECRRTLP